MKALLFYTTSGDLIKKFTDFNNSDDALRQVEEEFMQGKDEEYIFCHKKLSFAESCANHNAVAQASFQRDYNGFQKLTNLIGANRNVENLSISVIVEKDEKKVQILADIRDNYQNLRNNEFNNDKFLVKEAINVNSKALQYASSVLKNDREVVLKAVRQDGTTLQHASEKIRSEDKEIILEAVKHNGLALKNVYSPTIKYRDNGLTQSYGLIKHRLGYGNPDLRIDPEIMLAALKQVTTNAYMDNNTGKTNTELFLEHINTRELRFTYIELDKGRKHRNLSAKDLELALEGELMKQTGLPIALGTNADGWQPQPNTSLQPSQHSSRVLMTPGSTRG